LALNSRGSVDPRWLTHNRGVLRALQLAEVEIYSADNASQSYDAESNSWTSSAIEVYIGRARVQPVNAVNESGDNFNPSFFKTVRVQISYNKNEVEGATADMPDIRPGHKMRVTSAPYNETLSKFIYVVTDVLNSSNSWERTLLCKVDTELDPTVTGA
jgi:hypothetical protein